MIINREEIMLPEWIVCPEDYCHAREIVHFISPDVALLNMMSHFMNAHMDMDPLELLDRILYDTTNPLVTNGA